MTDNGSWLQRLIPADLAPIPVPGVFTPRLPDLNSLFTRVGNFIGKPLI